MESPACYDYYLKPNYHIPSSDVRQRYISPTTGKCRELVVQCTVPNPENAAEIEVTGGPSWTIRLATALVENPPRKDVETVLLWFGRWLGLILVLIWPFTEATYTGKYKPYISRFWGQLWAARSKREYELRKQLLRPESQKLDETPEEEELEVRMVTHASFPRKLMIYNVDMREWMPSTDEEKIKDTKYLAVSYRLADFYYDASALQHEIEVACSQIGISGYWFDQVCIGQSQEEKNMDLYRMADVYRGADKTLIMIAGPDENAGWKSWGGRIWTLPEALLSRELLCKVGSGPIQTISLRQVANKAYTEADIEMALINGFSGKDPLPRLERLSMLKAAIWRRSSAMTVQASTYPAERVYALMGFWEHRIMPHPEESVLKALARLSMINNTDRFVERMVSLLPTEDMDNRLQACWYADDDVYDANLWDIEPVVQVAGISVSEALVLDGCRAAAIRWKNFPKVAYALKPGFRRSLARYATSVISYFIIFGLLLLVSSDSLRVGGGVIFAIGIVASLGSPWLIEYANSGRVIIAEPWLIGVKGFYTVEELSARLYGFPNASPECPKVTYSPSGSIFARPDTGSFRRGDAFKSSAAARHATNVYTLVDTRSNTVYHFTAKRPPTVCVYTGQEGGLGRFLLCSESCHRNELHKETVLRMPNVIANAMPICDWIAIGSQ